MSKNRLTPEGVTEKQDEISKLSEEERLRISELIASDPLSWISDNFEMSDEQIEYFAGLPIVDSKITGWSLAIGILGQIPVRMDDTTPPSGATGKKKKSLTVSSTTTTNPNTGQTTTTGTISMNWTW